MESPAHSVEPVNFGKSLIVPSVQQLARECTDKIPPRYERPQIEPLVVSDNLDWAVPVIDLQKLASDVSKSSESESELRSLHSACKDWGFFQVVNHGVSKQLLDELRLEVANFFRLPHEEKKRKQLWQQPDNHEGFGQLFVISEEQKLDWSDMFYITTLPHTLRHTELFDKLPRNLRETLETYCSELRRLALRILSYISKSLGMDVKEMEDLFMDGVQSMRMNYYPPCPEPVNIGDIMEIVSNGVYRSIEHRAAVNSTRERLSVATFYSCKLNCTLGPAPSLVGPRNPAVFRQVPVEEYFKEFFGRRLNGKSYLDFMRIDDEE
ncbi:Protein SRG1 [Linum perenne]